MNACRRPALRRWIAGVAFAALLLKAAVPLLATSAADTRDLAVGDICSVWGVKLPQPAADAGGHAPQLRAGTGHGAPAHGSDDKPHGAESCALSALAPLAGACDTATQPAAPAAPAALAPPAAPPRGTLPDAEAAWFARLKQGPPAA